ncbi:MAG TPA: hypothetical protein VLH58_14010 [Candidatus Methylomirabilis sp.]|nr:hypothetical protein [Candidatus Methylomirabilis sp.]HSC72467.1 hypothetical protein [Candidatus Methylomirabilis sp.]
MGKHKQRNKPSAKALSRPRRARFLVPGALALAVVAGLVTWYLLPRQSPLSDAAQFRGGARLAVDKELIDFGTIRFNKMVDARFLLKNVGDQPLKLAVDQRVEAIEGC